MDVYHDYGHAERVALDRSGDGTSYAVVQNVSSPAKLNEYAVVTLAAARKLEKQRRGGSRVWELVYKGPRNLSATQYDRGDYRSRIPGVTYSNPGWSIPGVSNMSLTQRSARAKYRNR